MQSDTLKAISTFLEANKLNDTLAALISQTQRNQGSRKPEKHKSSIQNISKVRIDYNDEQEVSQIRDLLQHTDESALKRLVTKLNSKLQRNQSKELNLSKLKDLKFYKKLVEKQTIKLQQQALKRRQNRVKNGQISFIAMDMCNDDSIISRPQQAILILEQETDQYDDEQDLGFLIYDVSIQDFQSTSDQVAVMKDYPRRALLPKSDRFPAEYYQNKDSYKKQISNNPDANHIKLPKHFKFPQVDDDFYPIEFDGTIYDVYNLKIVYDQNKVGFQLQRSLDLTKGNNIAGRYQIIDRLGSAQFSIAVRVVDIYTKQQFCMKVISNNKDYVDQSLDQIKLLTYLNINGNPDEKCILKCYDFFYYKEHLIILTQLLKFDLYKTLCEYNQPLFFNMKCIQAVSKQILVAMEYIHSLHIIHSDLKPENILIKSMSQRLIKVIDFGNSVFFHDLLSFYIQTRSYRAPQVILGCSYDQKIDIWSVGCIVAQLWTGKMLFQNQSAAQLLAKHQGIVGPWPEWMLEKAKEFQKYFTKNLVLYENIKDQNDQTKVLGMKIIVPKKTNLQARLGTKDAQFVDFVRRLLILDPTKRPSATQALKHPFLTKKYYD